jgi:hypothetical protein
MAERRTVRERVAGQSAMRAVLAAQAATAPRDRRARALGLSPLAAPSRPAYRAALAELAVGDALELLGPRWDVLHDLPVGAGSVDHLVIGPAGVFVVRAVQCAGADVDDEAIAVDLATAAAQADAVGAVLGVRADPLVVLVQARRVQARGLAVLEAGELHRMLTRAPQRLDGDTVAALSDIADLPSSWAEADGAVDDARRLHLDFAALRSTVDEAAQVRLAWALGVAAVVLATVWTVVAAATSITTGVALAS